MGFQKTPDSANNASAVLKGIRIFIHFKSTFNVLLQCATISLFSRPTISTLFNYHRFDTDTKTLGTLGHTR